MKHHIIVKFSEQVSDKAALIAEIEPLFARCTEIEGVHGCEILKNCIARENRYDIMIVISMEKEALPLWDASAIHKQWKSEYGCCVGSKAIFDCE